MKIDMGKTKNNVFAEGSRVILRDTIISDFDHIVRSNFRGEHLIFDAPWEHKFVEFSDEQIEEYKQGEPMKEFKTGFLKRIEQEKPTPRGNAIIATKENLPIGGVSRYFQKDNKDAPFIGVSIEVDEYLNQGLGTEAFKLWLDYQFTNSKIHRIGAEAWSFNPRAIRVVEKLGFVHEGTHREMREWKGQRLDKILFGMLRSEWENICSETELKK